MTVTLDQIAANLGVSKATVSRALNGKGRMADETRSRILVELDTAGYRPDPAARELSKRSGQSIGVSYDKHDVGPYFTLFWRALGQISGERGLRLIHLSEPLESYKRLPDAVLVHNTKRLEHQIGLLQQRSVPTVVLGRRGDTAFVVPDDVGGANEATRYLLALGHREIVYLGSISDHQLEIDRRTGYRKAMMEAGIAPRSAFELEGHFTILGGYRGIRRAWEGGLRFTAVFCGCDEMAVGAIGALEDLDINVPDEVSVIGFDGLLGMYGSLTTMVQDIGQIAAQAVETAEAMISGAPQRAVIVPVHLREGTSTGPLRSP